MLFIPGDRFDQPVAEAGPGAEAKLLLGPGSIQTAARLAVRLGRVPTKRALEGAQLADRFGKHADGDLLPRTDVNRVWLVVVLRGENDTLGGIADEQELPGRGAGPPHVDVVTALVASFDCLADQG